MTYNAFVGGIQPGGLTNDFEVKILICYLLEHIGEPTTFEQINQILQETGLVNYFEFAESMSELEHTGHLQRTENEEGEPCFAITDIGTVTSQTFDKALPLTVREKTIQSAQKAANLKRRLGEVEIKYRPATDGYIFSVTMKDTGSDLMNLNIFLPSEEECISVKEKIYEDPLNLYQGILNLILGES